MADLAAKLSLRKNPPALSPSLLTEIQSMDCVPAAAFHSAGLSLYILGWDGAAIDAFDHAARCDGRYFRTWNMLGVSLVRRATALSTATQPDYLAARADLLRARECFQNALDRCSSGESRPGLETNLGNVTGQLEALQRGEILPTP
jgi:hypothetical protein